MNEVQKFISKNQYQLGYIMQEASRQWIENDPVGALTVGDCNFVIQKHGQYHELLEKVEEQQKEIDELKNKNKWLKYELDKEVHVGDKLEKDNDRLREALEFYADEDNHDFEIDVTTSHLDANSPILNDRGEKAREALEQR